MPANNAFDKARIAPCISTSTNGADDPLLAFEDAIREFSPDHLLVALRGRDRAGWQERGLIDAMLERFDIPITVFELSPD